MLPPAATEMLQACSEHDTADMCLRLRRWEAECKDVSRLAWCSLKRDLMQKDLEVVRESTANLRHDCASQCEKVQQLGQLSKTIKASLQRQQEKREIQRSVCTIQECAQEIIQSKADDQKLLGSAACAAVNASRRDEEEIAKLEKRLQEARQSAEEQRRRVRDLQRTYLRVRMKRVNLQREQYAHTCQVSQLSPDSTAPTKLSISFRCGARAIVEKPAALTESMDPSASAHVTLELPPAAEAGGCSSSAADEAKRAIIGALFSISWCEALSRLPRVSTSKATEEATSTFEAQLPWSDVSELLWHLDVAAVHISRKMEALEDVFKHCPEAVNIAATIRKGTMGAGATLAVAVTLVVVRSHIVVSGPPGMLPLVAVARPGASASARVDATKCILEFDVEPEQFPHAVSDWSGVAVRQVFGRNFEAAAVTAALQQKHGHSEDKRGLRELLTTAIEAMRGVQRRTSANPVRSEA